jgi:molybdate transport system regulatory protein
MEIKSKVWLEKDGKLVFGKGKALILRAVGETGSINKAAEKMNMSYRRAWSYIRSAEKRLGTALLIKSKGGKNGGGCVLTDYAKNLLEKFDKFEHEIKIFTDNSFKKYFPDGII